MLMIVTLICKNPHRVNLTHVHCVSGGRQSSLETGLEILSPWQPSSAWGKWVSDWCSQGASPPFLTHYSLDILAPSQTPTST
jgi:hypothetical protein